MQRVGADHAGILDLRSDGRKLGRLGLQFSVCIHIQSKNQPHDHDRSRSGADRHINRRQMREEADQCVSVLVIIILIVLIFVSAPVISFFSSAAGACRAFPVFPLLLLLEVIIIVQLRAGRGRNDFVKRQCVGFVKIVLSGRGFGGRSGFFLPLLFFLFTDPLCFLLSGLQDDFVKGNRIGLIQRLILRRSLIHS